MIALQAPTIATATPVGETPNGRAYDVFDGAFMHDGITPNPVRITVNYTVKPVTGEIYWATRDCNSCHRKNTHEGKPCIHQAKAITKHVELFGDADIADAKKRFGVTK